MKLELVEGYREETNESILGLCFTEKNAVIETLAVLVSTTEVVS